jgi:hypothetical protein
MEKSKRNFQLCRIDLLAFFNFSSGPADAGFILAIPTLYILSSPSSGSFFCVLS